MNKEELTKLHNSFKEINDSLGDLTKLVCTNLKKLNTIMEDDTEPENTSNADKKEDNDGIGLKKPYRQHSESNICLLTDNNGYVTSDYGFNYEKISRILKDKTTDEYIKDGDWIVIVTNEGYNIKLVLNVNPYLNDEESEEKTGLDYHHIDFISNDLIPGSSLWNTDDPDKDRYDFIIDKLNNEFINTLSDKLVKHIESKEISVNSDVVLVFPKYDANFKDEIKEITQRHCGVLREKEELGRLWIPFLSELNNCNLHCLNEGNLCVYPSLDKESGGLNKTDKLTNSKIWWTASSYSSNLLKRRNYAIHSESESYLKMGTNCDYIAVPLCFRFV